MIIIPIANGPTPQKRPQTQENNHQRYQRYYHIRRKSRKMIRKKDTLIIVRQVKLLMVIK